MNTKNRLLLLGTLCALLPIFGTASLLGDVRGEKGAEFLSLLQVARSTYQERNGISSTERWSKEMIATSQKNLADLGRQKRQVRLQIRDLRTQYQTLQGGEARILFAQERAQQMLHRQEEQLLSFVLAAHQHGFVVASASDGLNQELRGMVLADIERQMQASVLDQQKQLQAEQALLPEKLTALAKKMADADALYVTLSTQYAETDSRIVKAQHSIVSGEQQSAEIKRIFAQVQRDVLQIQSELARIDARLRAKAERALISMGLRDPRVPVDGSASSQRSFSFAWPVHGPLTATFHDTSYQTKFGIPHLAIDIATHQGTPVGVAADGIVFIVRDGGETGYTYVLIGHRDGYATLYGHLSAVSVAPGQEVKQGETIGLSGGQPGTPGAGPMTTGQHLHFEVISQGTNIDPLTVLPH